LKMNLCTETSKLAKLAVWHGLITLGLLAGCAGEVDSGPVGQVDSGLPKDQSVAELTTEEEDTLCRAQVRARNDRVLALDVCADEAYFEAAASSFPGSDQTEDDLRQICAAFYEMCVEVTDPEDFLLTGTCAVSSNPCAATVGQVEACWTEELERDLQPAPEDCDSVTFAGVSDFLDSLVGQPELPACETLGAECPDLFHP
jgi:hypothetical protein